MATIKALKILLAEDNVDHAELIIDTLKDFNLGNDIVHVGNGEEVVIYLKKCVQNGNAADLLPNLILLDLKMPRMDGASALKEVRAMPECKHIPIIMISTSSMEQEIKSCYEYGANSYITKPLRFEDFCKKIKELNLYWVLTAEIPTNR